MNEPKKEDLVALLSEIAEHLKRDDAVTDIGVITEAMNHILQDKSPSVAQKLKALQKEESEEFGEAIKVFLSDKKKAKQFIHSSAELFGELINSNNLRQELDIATITGIFSAQLDAQYPNASADYLKIVLATLKEKERERFRAAKEAAEVKLKGKPKHQ